MADVWYKTGTFDTAASGTTVIGSLPGTGPVFIHLWWVHTTSDNTVTANQQFGHGFSDGTLQDCLTTTADDGANLNERDGRNNNWCLISDPTSTGTDLVLGSTVAMNTNDVTLSYTTFTSGHVVNYEIWGGSGTTVSMNEHAAAVANSPFTHSLGTKPDLILFCTNGQAHPASSVHSYLSYGVANDNGSSIDQWVLYSYLGDSDTDFVGSALTVGDNAGQFDSDFADWDSTITAISTTTYTWTETAAPGTDDVITACLNFQGDGAVGVKVGTFTKSTASAPTTQAMPTFGFTPMGYAVATANYTSSTKPGTNTDRIAHVSFGAYDGTTQVSALTVGTIQSNADRASITRNNEVLQGSPALQATGVDFSGTAQAITDATPDIEWNPNTSDAVHIGFYGIELQASDVVVEGIVDPLLLAEGTATIVVDHSIDGITDALVLSEGLGDVVVTTTIVVTGITDSLLISEGLGDIVIDHTIVGITDALVIAEGLSDVVIDHSIDGVTDALIVSEGLGAIVIDHTIEGVLDALLLSEGLGTIVHNTVVITDVNTTESWNDGDTGLVITGTGFVS